MRLSSKPLAAAAVLLLLTLSRSTSTVADEIRTFPVNSTSDLISALEAVQRYLASGSGGYFRLAVARGVYQLVGPRATALATFENVSHISIVGEGRETTEIDGGGEAGFVFREVSLLTVANITFSNCSSLQTSTTTIISQLGNLSFVDISSALYLSHCSHVNIESAAVNNSQAVGLAMFNIRGTNTFSNAVFSGNSPPSPGDIDSGYGGGGVILEFSFCRPGDLGCNNSDPVEVSDASFNFTSCQFTGNTASLKGLDVSTVYPHGTEHVGFGKGGGLAVYFRGRSINNSVTLRNCHTAYNVARFGGGLYVEFGDESEGNVFSYTGDEGGNSVIGLNGPFCDDRSHLSQRETAGGGAMVVFLYYPPDPALWPGYHADVSDNRVEFRGTYFSANMACWGGGASVMSSRSLPGSRQTNSILFTDCQFQENKAVSSAALDVSVLHPDSSGGGQLLTPSISGCLFSSNTAHTRSSSLVPNLAGYQFGIGAVYLNTVSANFSGENHFTGNQGSGLVVSGAEVFVSEGSSLVFERNTGRRGGAMVIIGGGSIVTFPGAILSFSFNQAFEVGGAIYSEGLLGEGDLINQQCFVRYHQPTVHPSQWNVSFIFSNNSNEDGSTLYVTSLLPCVWRESGAPGLDVSRALCWPGWVYDGLDAAKLGNCSRFIGTAPASFNNSDSNQVYHMSLYPGHTATIPVRMRDDYGDSVDRVVFHISSNDSSRVEVADTSVYITDNQISIHGVPDSPGEIPNLFLETPGPRVLTTVLHVSVLPCPPGYTPEFVNEDSTGGGMMVRRCKCAYSLYFTCNSSDMSAHILPGYCVRYQNSSEHSESRRVGRLTSSTPHQTMIVVECPATIKTGQPVELPACNDSNSCRLEERFCAAIGRSGQFCSGCANGSTVDVNDIHNCVECSEAEYQYGWFIYLLTNIVPITLFFVVVTLFKISATSAPMYGFVFFAQVTTVPYFHNRLPWIFGLSEQTQLLRSVFLFPYSVWNLDFFIFTGVICLSEDLTVMYTLLLKYLLALYPMLLILASYVCIELYDHNYRLVVWLWRPFRACLKRYRRSWKPRTSIIDAFATFLMISYTKVTVITICLLTPAQPYYAFRDKRVKVDDNSLFYFDPQYSFFDGAHLILGLLALLVAVAFVLAPPLFLFLYPTKLFQRCLNRCSGRSLQTVNTFADAFQGCFKNHTNNNRDYRYFSGLYLLLRIVVLLIYAVDTSQVVQLLLQQVLCITAVLVFALVKPYKEAFFNKVDLTIFSLLALMNSLSFANFTDTYMKGELNLALFAVNYSVGFLPLLYISLYLLFLFLKWRGVIVTNPVVRELTAGKSTLSITSEDSSATDVPDRLLHPENYSINTPPPVSSVLGLNSNTGSSSSSEPVVSGSKDEKKAGPNLGSRRPSQRATERSYFLNKARYMKNYSSM